VIYIYVFVQGLGAASCFIVYHMIKLESNIYAVEISCDVQIIANETNYDIENPIAITIVYYFAIHYELLIATVYDVKVLIFIKHITKYCTNTFILSYLLYFVV
jgi:hypothetical protein